jgi:flagellar protein FlbD
MLPMIKVTRLDGEELVVNSDLIEFVQTTPDTILTLTTGRKILVRESMDEVVARVIGFRQCIHQVPLVQG